MDKVLGINWKPELRNVVDLKHWDKNPRKITEVNYARLKKKMTEEGMHQVLTVDTDDTVLSGNQRLDIHLELGLEQVWCMVPERALTAEERDKVGLQSNIIEGMWDADMLANNFEIPMLLEQGFTKLQLGMNPFEEDNFDADKEMDGVKPLAEPGDIYQLGEHRIMCGDSTSMEDVEKLMGGGPGSVGFYGSALHGGLPLGARDRGQASRRQQLCIQEIWRRGYDYFQRQPVGGRCPRILYEGAQKSVSDHHRRCVHLLVARGKARVDESARLSGHRLEDVADDYLDQELDGVRRRAGLSSPV